MRNTSTQIMQQHAEALHANGELAQAQKLLEIVLRLQPHNLPALQRLGVLALQTGQSARGIALLERALSLQPGDTRLLANLGNGYLLAQRSEDALRCYDTALALEPGFIGALNNRCNALLTLGRVEDAAESYARLCSLDSAHPFAIGSQFQCRRKSCDWSEFQPRVGQISQRLSKADSSIGRSRSFLWTGLPRSSCAAHRSMPRIYAPDPLRRYGRGRVRAAIGSGLPTCRRTFVITWWRISWPPYMNGTIGRTLKYSEFHCRGAMTARSHGDAVRRLINGSTSPPSATTMRRIACMH